MLIIGESINGTISKVGQAIQEKNEAFLRELAKTQYECGAQVLDINAGVAGGNEVEDLPWLIKLVQKEVMGKRPEGIEGFCGYAKAGP